MTNSNPLYLALDSDILRELSYLVMVITKEKDNFDIKKIDSPYLQKCGADCLELLKLVKQDKIRLFIPKTVYNESKHSQALCTFMRKTCYFSNPRTRQFKKNIHKSRVLAATYCEPYTDKNNKLQPPPMLKEYSEYYGEQVPSNDAYIMAQATVEGCYAVLTNNNKHFKFDKKDDGNTYRRSEGIDAINKNNGFIQETQKNRYVTTQPLSISAFLRQYKKYDLSNWKDSSYYDDESIVQEKISGREVDFSSM